MLIYLVGMTFLNIITPTRAFSESENRKLEQAPHFSFYELFDGSFTSNYEKYIADQFALKDFWIGVKSGFERVLGKKEYNGVYIGKDDYLLQIFKEPKDESFQSKMDAVNMFGASTPKMNKYFMLVPNSVEILSDKLPPYVQRDSQQKWIQLVKNSLDKNIKFVDMYDILYAKKNEYVFYKTDHHWTTKAAFYAYQELIKATGENPHAENFFDIKQVTDNFYGSLYSKSGLKQVRPDSINLYVPKDNEIYNIEYFDEEGKSKVLNSLYNMDNINKKDKYALFLDGNHALIKISTNNFSMKKLLVIKDSYANCLIPFLTGHYSEIYVVDLRFYGDDLSDIIKNNDIEDMLVLYNVNTFFEDASVESILDYIDLDNLNSDNGDMTEGTFNYKEFFKQDVFMGDSITEAIAYNGILEQKNVCSKVGVNINEAKFQISSIKIENPRNIYLLYGVNDMDDRNQIRWFVDQYRDLVRNTKKSFPNSKIYIQSVLPVASTLEQRKPHTNNNYINECNESLIEMAKEENVQFLNIAALLNDSNQNLFEQDGFHFKTDFYYLWFNYLIKNIGV